jgi:hypothetical protein
LSPDHHIPLRPADLIRKLADEPAVTIFEREQFRALCQLAQATIHHEYHERLKDLKSVYAPFDPDSDAQPQDPSSTVPLERNAEQLFDQFDALLTRANYQKLARDQIVAALRSPSHTGLRLQLNLDLFERLEVYVRGHCELTRKRRGWAHTSGGEAKIPAYRRLAIIFRLKAASPLTDPLDTQAVVLKLFKDIPCEDLETLLPGAQVRISLAEQARIVLPTLSGLGLTLFKLIKGAAALAVAELYSLAAMLGLIGGAIGYGLKSFHGYLRTREKHQLSLTRHLYYQNLDNNAGVIYHLLAEAEEQEFRELILGWWLLWRGGLIQASAEQLDAAAEAWLQSRCGIKADFEVADALAKLHRLGLAFRSPTGRWRAVTIDQALETLVRAWDDQFSYRAPSASKEESQPQPRIYRRAA